jgi:hypothetical protein
VLRKTLLAASPLIWLLFSVPSLVPKPFRLLVLHLTVGGSLS